MQKNPLPLPQAFLSLPPNYALANFLLSCEFRSGLKRYSQDLLTYNKEPELAADRSAGIAECEKDAADKPEELTAQRGLVFRQGPSLRFRPGPSDDVGESGEHTGEAAPAVGTATPSPESPTRNQTKTGCSFSAL